ncbi:MAG: hypothetical protein WAN36_12025 [Calditrichia bacterium]
MSKRFITGFIIAACLVFAGRQTAGAADSRYAGSFLELGVGARAMAMGGAYVAVADDGFAFYWNPAGASIPERMTLSGMYASLFKSLEQHHHIGVVRPLYGGAAFSLNWIRLGISDIPRYYSENLQKDYSTRVNDESTAASSWQELQELGTVLTDAPLGYNSFTSDAFFLTLSRQFKFDIDFGWQYFVLPAQMPVGLNFKFIRQSLFDRTASGIGLDAGWMFKFGLNDLFDENRLGKISFGLAAKDIFNTKITWNTDSRFSSKIKRSWQAGVSYFQPISRIRGQLLFSYALSTKYDKSSHYGLEYDYLNRLAVRFGLDNDQFSAGVGLKVMIFHFDYAYIGHELGGSHRISTEVRF